MKAKITLILLISLLFIFTGCIGKTIIKGDGDIVTETVSIGDYKKISLAGSVKVDYTQSESEPYLEVTLDKNIFEKFEFVVEEGDHLNIRPKKEYRRNTHFRPTEFNIKTNSHGLAGIMAAGQVEFNVNSPLEVDDLNFKLAGSGKINLNQRVTVKKFQTEIAGNTTLNAMEVFSNEFNGRIAGSGTMNVGGSTESADFDIAGSGDFRGFQFHIDDLKCKVAGSGDIEAYVNNSIDIKVAGSGRVKYKGNPANITRKILGSGSVKKVD